MIVGASTCLDLRLALVYILIDSRAPQILGCGFRKNFKCYNTERIMENKRKEMVKECTYLIINIGDLIEKTPIGAPSILS